MRVYNAANREKLNAQRRLSHAANRDKNNKRQRLYRAANRDKINEHVRLYRAANRDKINEQQRWRARLYRPANRDKLNARIRWCLKNDPVFRVRMRERERAYRRRNIEQFRSKSRDYYVFKRAAVIAVRDLSGRESLGGRDRNQEYQIALRVLKDLGLTYSTFNAFNNLKPTGE
jgi:hypothetical protein